jgi:hypothetical protein
MNANLPKILLYHSRNLKDSEEIENYFKNYKYHGEIVTVEEAIVLKRKGAKVYYPQKPKYHFVIQPHEDDYIVKKLRTPIAAKDIHVCLVGDFNKQHPTRKMLNLLHLLLNSICSSYEIPVENILPWRYLKPGSDHPGLLFNVKRFVNEYFGHPAI